MPKRHKLCRRSIAAVSVALFLLVCGCTSDPTTNMGADDAELTGAQDADQRDADAREDDRRDATYADADAQQADADSDAGPAPADADSRDADAGEVEPPVFQAFFSLPEPGTPDETLEEVIIEQLDEAPVGATVRAAYFTFSRGRMARAFARAYERGVDVRLILGNTNRHDDGSDWNAVGILRERLGDRLTICREGQSSGGCIGEGINHNKFILFSELGDGSRNVVLQSSANLTNPQLRMFNNLVLIRGDDALYNGYADYWYDLHQQQLDLSYYHSVVGDLGTKAYFYPRASGDTIVNILENVDCNVGADIHIGMAYFTNPRDAIAERLAQMDGEGCGVHVIVREKSVGDRVLAALDTGGIDLSMFRNSDEVEIHSKYLLVDGAYGSNTSHQKLVWTGSHNYTGGALRRNDEVLLKIRQDEIYDAFLDNWNHVRSHAHTVR